MRVSIWRLGVAAPVGAGDDCQLERLDPLGARAVRAAAEVGERAVAVERDGLDALVADQVLDQLDLVVLALGAEALDAPPPTGTSVRSKCSSALMCSRIFCLDALEVVLARPSRPRGTRSRSRSRPRSAGRSRSSRRGRAPAPPWRARARRRGGSAERLRARSAVTMSIGAPSASGAARSRSSPFRPRSPSAARARPVADRARRRRRRWRRRGARAAVPSGSVDLHRHSTRIGPRPQQLRRAPAARARARRSRGSARARARGRRGPSPPPGRDRAPARPGGAASCSGVVREEAVDAVADRESAGRRRRGPRPGVRFQSVSHGTRSKPSRSDSSSADAGEPLERADLEAAEALVAGQQQHVVLAGRVVGHLLRRAPVLGRARVEQRRRAPAAARAPRPWRAGTPRSPRAGRPSGRARTTWQHERARRGPRRAGAPRGPAAAARARGCAESSGSMPGGAACRRSSAERVGREGLVRDERRARSARAARAPRGRAPRPPAREASRWQRQATRARRAPAARPSAPGSCSTTRSAVPLRLRPCARRPSVQASQSRSAMALSPPRSPCVERRGHAPQVGVRRTARATPRRGRRRPPAAAGRRAAREPAPGRRPRSTWRTARRAAAPPRPGRASTAPAARERARSRPAPARRRPSAGGPRPRRERTRGRSRDDPAAHLAQRLAPQHDFVAVLEERARRAVGQLDRLLRRPGQLEQAAALLALAAPRSCRCRAGRRCAGVAPFEVRWAICWAIDQYRWRAFGARRTVAVAARSRAGGRAPTARLAQVGQRLGLLRLRRHAQRLELGQRHDPARDRGRERLAQERAERPVLPAPGCRAPTSR